MSEQALMPLYEVFVRSRRGLDHVHVGSLHAPDDATALEYGRETYLRRGEGASLWVVPTRCITASQESDVPSFYDPMDEKPYRHATYYELPDGVRNL